MSKDFKAYPIRHIRLSDEVWEEFKGNKEKFGSNWNKFIDHINQLIKQDNESINKTK